MSETTMTTKDNAATAGLRPLALLATGSTGADIERLVREARAHCRRSKQPLTWEVLEAALRQDRDDLSKDMLYRIAVHEIGHALAYELAGLGEVSTVRLHGLGGNTEVLLDRERLQFTDGMLDNLTCTFGGRAAEAIVFGEKMVGSGGQPQSDLGLATRIALEIETAFGMGEDHPLVYCPPTNPGDMLLYNQALTERVQKRLDDAERQAVQLLEPYRHLIEALGHQLARAQVLEGDMVKAALAAARE